MSYAEQWLFRRPDADVVRATLHEVTDPDSGIDIVDLGLVYDVDIHGRAIRVRLTMTTPSCPLSGMIVDEVRTVLAYRFPRYRVEVDLVWTPPWHPSMIAPMTRMELGLP